MKKKIPESDFFNILREVNNKPSTSQRQLAKATGFSLGKLNYCLKALIDKGLVKINNFEKNSNKINYLYVLTPKGLSQKTKLTINFMKKKMIEYEQLDKELKIDKEKKLLKKNQLNKSLKY